MDSAVMSLLLDTITVRSAALSDRFSLAATAGYAGLELWGGELEEHPEGVAGIRALSDRFNMPVLGFCPHRSLLDWHHRWDKALEAAFESQLARYSQSGADYLVLPVLSEHGTLADTEAHLRRIAIIASQFGITAALEPIGHVRKLSRFADALTILQRVPNAGLIVDAFHFFRGGNRLDILTDLDPSRITVVHLDDATDLPIDQLLGFKHRLYPGHGIFDVVGFCAALRRIGYRGRYAVELLNPAYWDANPAEVSMTAWQTSIAVLEAAERLCA
jgi:sugar phosphate isomerase/epimerase